MSTTTAAKSRRAKTAKVAAAAAPIVAIKTEPSAPIAAAKRRGKPLPSIPRLLIGSYFEGAQLNRIVRHQLESYNNVVEYQLMKTIEMFNKPEPITSPKEFNPIYKRNGIEIYIHFEHFQMEKPQIYEVNGVKNDMFPNKARLRNFTYSAPMFLDVQIQTIVRSGEHMEHQQRFNKVMPRIHIGKWPIMLKSAICMLTEYAHMNPALLGECPYDTGGYFIINGSEKTVLGQERAAENRVQVFNVSKNDTKFNWKAEIKSVPDFKCISPKQINVMISSKDNGFGMPIMIQLPRMKQPIALFVIFRALGVISDKEICDYILLNTDAHLAADGRQHQQRELALALQASIIDANRYLTEDECLRHITNNVIYTPVNTMDKEVGQRKKHEFALDVLANDLFPHCPTRPQKLYFLGMMTYKLLMVSLGMLPTDDRDSYVNKRIDLTGTLLNNLFRNYFNKFVKDTERQIVKEIDNGAWRATNDYNNIVNAVNAYKIFKPTTIENNIKRALSTGDFSIKHINNNNNKAGVAQVLNRLNYTSALSHLRRISTPTDKSGKLIPPRKLHETSWGFVCCAETPEGQSVGIVKNLAYMTHVTIQADPAPIHEFMSHHIVPLDGDPTATYGRVKVLVNGVWIGCAPSDDAMGFYFALKECKHRGVFNIYTSIVFDYRMKEIRVCTDGGRVCRPLLRVCPINRGLYYNDAIVAALRDKTLTWDSLLLTGGCGEVGNEAIIEYIDAEEQLYSLIAMTPHHLVAADAGLLHYTHCEIHASTIFGVLASCIPFPEKNQSPRNTYQSAQAKQAIGVYATNFPERLDKTAYILEYPQRPLVETWLMDLLNLHHIPAGYNAMVAIMAHTGYNQEDSILLNQGAIDRGMFTSTIFHTEKDEDKQKTNGDEEIRCKPNPAITKKMKFANYDKVGPLGFVPKNTLAENKTIIIAKVTPIKKNRNDDTQKIKYEDQSKMYRTAEPTYIDKNYMNKNGDGYNFAKVRLRALRPPTIGDKFASRAGQKGTTGLIIPECDMPFTAAGVRPDIIINPHAIPSRMTIAQLTETLMTTVLAELGMFGDGTPFGDLTLEDIRQILLEMGHETDGNHVMYDPMTGEQLTCSIFMGLVFYQRLKHMVNDKVHSRASGPMVNLTRQPAEGRSRDGGLRFGEMERDACIAHGIARFTRDRMYDTSDKFAVHICKACGLRAAYNEEKGIHRCLTCNNMTEFRRVEVPYASKLLDQELQTMNITMRYVTE